MKKATKIILGLIIVILVGVIGVKSYFLIKEKNNNNNNNNNVLYTYGSADNSSTNGNGELLYVYEMNDNIIKFKYHTPWSENDITGTATKATNDLYVYQKDNYKIEIQLNTTGDNSLKITEYENNSVTSWKNLWK